MKFMNILLQVQVRGVSGDGVLGVADPAGEEGHGTELLLSACSTKGQSNMLNVASVLGVSTSSAMNSISDYYSDLP